VDPAYLNAKDEVQTGEKPLPFCLWKPKKAFLFLSLGVSKNP
jgi:hypothetical protein